MCINDLIAILFDIILQNNIFSIVALMISWLSFCYQSKISAL